MTRRVVSRVSAPAVTAVTSKVSGRATLGPRLSVAGSRQSVSPTPTILRSRRLRRPPCGAGASRLPFRRKGRPGGFFSWRLPRGDASNAFIISTMGAGGERSRVPGMQRTVIRQKAAERMLSYPLAGQRISKSGAALRPSASPAASALYRPQGIQRRQDTIIAGKDGRQRGTSIHPSHARWRVKL